MCGTEAEGRRTRYRLEGEELCLWRGMLPLWQWKMMDPKERNKARLFRHVKESHKVIVEHLERRAQKPSEENAHPNNEEKKE